MSNTEAQQPPVSEWWVYRWKSQIVTGLSLLQVIFGVIVPLSFSPITCTLTGLAFVFGAFVVLAIEAPSFVSFIRFAQPIGLYFEGKPLWIKCATYAGLTIFPCIFNCYGTFFYLGFMCSLGTTAVYGAILVGQKASQDEMRFQAGGFSPTNP